MGKYLLLEFDNDDQAESLYARINDAAQRGKAYRVIGLFQKPPKKRCECTKRQRGRDNRIRRHKKTGFTYCLECKRVLPGWQAPRNFLDSIKLPAEYFSKRFAKEAQLHMDSKGEKPLKNFPITDRLAGRPLEDK